MTFGIHGGVDQILPGVIQDALVSDVPDSLKKMKRARGGSESTGFGWLAAQASGERRIPGAFSRKVHLTMLSMLPLAREM